MARHIEPDNRIEMPELYELGRMPSDNNYEIDIHDPEADGLSHFLLFNNNNPRDLVTGVKLNKFNGTKWTPNKGQFFDEVNDYAMLPDVTLNSKFTIITNMNFTDNVGSNFQYFFSFGVVSSANSVNLFLREAGNSPANSLQSTGSIYTRHLDYFPAKNGKQLSLTLNGTNEIAYSEGVELTNDDPSEDSLGMADGTTRDLYLGAREDLSSTRLFGGHLKYLMIYNNKDLNANEIKKMATNPYRFLIPQ